MRLRIMRADLTFALKAVGRTLPHRRKPRTVLLVAHQAALDLETVSGLVTIPADVDAAGSCQLDRETLLRLLTTFKPDSKIELREDSGKLRVGPTQLTASFGMDGLTVKS